MVSLSTKKKFGRLRAQYCATTPVHRFLIKSKNIIVDIVTLQHISLGEAHGRRRPEGGLCRITLSNFFKLTWYPRCRPAANRLEPIWRSGTVDNLPRIRSPVYTFICTYVPSSDYQRSRFWDQFWDLMVVQYYHTSLITSPFTISYISRTWPIGYITLKFCKNVFRKTAAVAAINADTVFLAEPWMLAVANIWSRLLGIF